MLQDLSQNIIKKYTPSQIFHKNIKNILFINISE